MSKINQTEVKVFSFQEIGNEKIIKSGSFREFSFGEISGNSLQSPEPDEKTIRDERKFESMTDFKIDEKVRQSRGLVRQEKNDIETLIKNEVEKRLNELRQAAFQEGFEKGRVEAFDSVKSELNGVLEEKITKIEEVIFSINNEAKDLLEKNRLQIFELVNRLTKWVILKEASKDLYIERLLEKLILELNEKRNLIIKVGKSNFSEMPEVIKHIEEQLGQLPNVRVEIVSEIKFPGIMLESDNALIDGTLESIFKNIDKIFEMVNTDVE